MYVHSYIQESIPINIERDYISTILHWFKFLKSTLLSTKGCPNKDLYKIRIEIILSILNQSDFKAKPLVSRLAFLTIVINNNSSAVRDVLLVTSENRPLVQSEDIITELPRPICFFPPLIKLTLFSNLNTYHLAKTIEANSYSIYLFHCHLVLKVLNSLLNFCLLLRSAFFACFPWKPRENNQCTLLFGGRKQSLSMSSYNLKKLSWAEWAVAVYDFSCSCQGVCWLNTVQKLYCDLFFSSPTQDSQTGLENDKAIKNRVFSVSV